MKASRYFNSPASTLLSITMTVFLLLFLTSCARKVAFQTSPIVPAAQGSVKIKKDNNNNYSLDISVRNLAEPKRLDPPRDTYVVWIDTERDGTKNIGQIRTSSGLFSSTLKASLTAITSFKPTRIFITAENNANVTFPGMQLVLQTNGF